jgi:uncharacterized protein (TIGR03437 family)
MTVLTRCFRGGLTALLLAAIPADAQQPVIAPGGVVSAASYSQPVAPGSIVSIFGTNLANTVSSATATPLLTVLRGTSVSMNGIPAPLFYVSPTQINAQVPSTLALSSAAYATANVVVTTGSGASAPAAVELWLEAPGVFTAQASGCGQAAALNVAPDGSLSPNTASNSAAPGDFVVLFGTGFGAAYFPPPDGSPATAAQNLEIGGGFTIDGGSVQNLQYFGLAPNLVGTDQANLQIPIGTRDGCAVPIAIVGGEFTISPTVSISVHSSRGQCVDPPTQSYGTIALVRTISTGTSEDGETDTLSASFPSGPQLVQPVESQTPVNGDIFNSPQFSGPSRSCPVAGYLQLSAGALGVKGPNGAAIVAPSSTSGSAAYSQNLPQGFLGAGTYSISASGGSIVGPFQGSVTLDAPIQITAVTPGETGSSGTPYTIAWTGGSPNDMVKVSLVSQGFTSVTSDYGYTPASTGFFSFQPICSGNPVSAGGNGVFCTFGIPGVTEVVVEQMPATAQVSSFQASGITGGIQVSWTYRYIVGLATSLVY